MVTKVLVERNIEDGRRVIGALEESGFPIEAALWVFKEDAEAWRLVIASPLVEEKGPLDAYAQVDSILQSLSPPPDLILSNISVISPKRELIQSLKPRRLTGSGRRNAASSGGMRYVAGGEAYVYPMPLNGS